MKFNYLQDGETILFLDPSANHLGWAVMTLNNGEALIINCGMLYASSSWPLGRRLHYMYQGLKYLIQYFKVNRVVTEDFVMPAFRQNGITVIPTINNNLKMLAYELSPTQKIEVEEISVPTWRRILSLKGIPAVDKKGNLKKTKTGRDKMDFKVPTHNKVLEVLGPILPKTIVSNTSLKPKDLPHDITDCLGISIAYALNLKYPKIKAKIGLFDNNQVIKTLFVMIKCK